MGPLEDPPGDPDRAPFRDYRARLAAVGFKPSSRRGQNFLLDPSLHRWIAAVAAPTSADTVIEIGVGLGFLTRELALRAGRLLGVEIEPRLLQIARAELRAATNVEWLLADALGGPGRTLEPHIVSFAGGATGRLLVVANLPYAVSGPVLAELAQLPRCPDHIVVLLQKELAQRLVAEPGSSAYGGLAVLLQALYSGRLLRNVPPEVFRPRPRVDSAVVGLERRPDSHPELAPPAVRRQFAQFVRALFGQRRKALRAVLAGACRAIGGRVPPLPRDQLQLRAEQLPADAFVALFRACTSG